MEIYRRTVSTRVRRLPERRLLVESALCDSFHEAYLELEVDRDTHVIQSAFGEFTRSPVPDTCPKSAEAVGKLVGIKAWPSHRGEIRDVLVGPQGCHRFDELAMECARAVAQADVPLKLQEKPWPEVREIIRDRLKDTCHAYSVLKDAPDWHDPTVDRPHNLEVFRRTVTSSVRRPEKRKLAVETAICDSMYELRLELEIDSISCQITNAKGSFTRAPHEELCSCTTKALEGLVGQMAKPGDNRALCRAVGGAGGCTRLEELVNDAVRAVIQGQGMLMRRLMTKHPERFQGAIDSDVTGDDSCIRFSRGSDQAQGVFLPRGILKS